MKRVSVLLVLAACASPSNRQDGSPELLLEVFRAEEERRFEEKSFSLWLDRGDLRTRVAAVRAMGRIGDPRAVPLLLRCSREGEEALRLEALFSLGQIGGVEAVTSIFEDSRDPSIPIRTFALEALGKSGEQSGAQRLVEALSDAEPGVRAEAALALFRLAGADSAKRLSLEEKSRRSLAVAAAARQEKNHAARWKMVFSLASLRDPATRAELRGFLADSQPLCRNFAAWGLDLLPPDPEDRSALRALLGDPEPDVVVRAALALADHPSAEVARSLANLLAHDSFHVRRAAVEALGGMQGVEDETRPLLERAWEDGSATVRAESALSAGRLLRADSVRWIEQASTSPHFLIRVKSAEACRFLPAESAAPLLASLSRDADLRCVSAATACLGHHEGIWSREMALAALRSADVSVRGEAAGALAQIGGASDLPALKKAFEDSDGFDMQEAREAIVEATARLGGEEAAQSLQSSLPPPAARIPGRDFPIRKSRPRVALEMEIGRLVIELCPEDAPRHVENFLLLVEAGHYDGTIFHRVVSNWVVQGGDHRGDGWGARSAWGDALRDEIAPSRYTRGSVGMPKSAEPDTGGCQIFITLLPTPRLDGRYTRFGQVVEGIDLLERIEIGEKIVRAKILFNP